jgi:hypothetical protein
LSVGIFDGFSHGVCGDAVTFVWARVVEALLFGQWLERIRVGVFLILEYQKSFRRLP